MTKIHTESRTFETRLLFIKEIFSDKFPPEVVLQSAIQYKLGASLEQYKIDTDASLKVLQTESSTKLLKKLNKIYKEL